MSAHHSLLAQLSSSLADPTDQILIQSILGTTDLQQVAELIEQICRLHLGQTITACEFWEVSVSLTIGLQLQDDQRVVLKFRSPDNISLETLQTVAQIQASLAAQGFPAPQILLAPIQYQGCFISIEQLLDAGQNCDAHNPEIREAMAIGLAQLNQLTQPFTQLPNLPRSRFRPAQLWEKPHNALFDFERTQSGAEWIDAIAAEAQQILLAYDAPLIVGHMDWSVKNMRFEQHRLSAVYDWDSLRLENELVIVGNAIKGFLVTWYVDAGVMVPTPTEAEQFIQAYETARAQPFTAAEHQIITATFIYSMAYTARCEHALDPAGQTLPDSFRTGLQNYRVYHL